MVEEEPVKFFFYFHGIHVTISNHGDNAIDCIAEYREKFEQQMTRSGRIRDDRTLVSISVKV